MLVFTTHDAGIYYLCWYLRRMMLVFMIHAGIGDSCWYLHFINCPATLPCFSVCFFVFLLCCFLLFACFLFLFLFAIATVLL